MALPELSHNLKSRKIAEATLKQVCKDIGVSAEDEIAYDGQQAEFLISMIADHLKVIDKSGSTRLSSVLYRVDIPEKLLGSVSSLNYYQDLAELVLRRCLQKVLIRMSYKPI